MTDNIEWLAGLLEGEGSFIEFQNRGIWRCKVYLKMTDLDIIQRAQMAANGVGTLCPANPPSKPVHWKNSWQWQVQVVPDVLEVMLNVLPYMGVRRTNKISQILLHATEQGWLNVCA